MTGTNLTIVAGVQEQHPSALKEENKDNNKQHEFSSSSGSIKSTVEEEEDDDDGRRNDDDLSGIISTSGFSSDDDGEEESEENALRNRIIRREEKAVRNSRWILIAAILIATVCTCVAVHAFAANGDKHAFELEYEGYVTDIINLVQWEVQYNFALMQQLSAAVTNTALVSGAVFPYLTDPNFEVIGGYADGMGGIMLAGFAPLVSATQRDRWEEYAYENQGWLERSERLKISHPGHRDALHGTIQDHEHDRRRRSLQQQEQQQGPPQNNDNEKENEKSSKNNFTYVDFYANAIHRQIYRWENGTRVPEEATSPEDNETIFAPLWQLSPADAGAVNVNLLSDERIRALYDAMIIANHSVISPGLPIADLFDFQFDASEKHYKPDPHGFLLEPVYDNFGDQEDADSSSPPTMVGFLIGLTSYRNLVTRLVPEGAAPGIVAVFRDSCGNDLTFSLHGHNATFMGYHDAHDEHFDQYRRSTVVELYNSTFGTNETAVPGLCVHQLHIYPTSTFRAAYNTNKPVVYTAVVALAFMLTSVVLLVYDRMVTKRQDKTMQSAVASNKVVSNLFPETVRERLLVQSGNNNNNHHHHKDHHVNNKKHQHQRQRGGRFGRGKQQQQQHSEEDLCGSEELLLHRSHSAVALASASASASSTGQYSNNNFTNNGSGGSCLSYKTRPIAEFYPNTTIMFADIVGFTAWSSTREPFQVFLLLETIFSEFDAIAKRRRVFKVETVGDCYVAVCGLPTPRSDHAAVMARFATDIRHKMKDLTQRLEVALGPDTNELTFRIGLHSGPITGGVLRGNNARYQLFGDAINTAARMESTCLPNRIQVSSETAELLIAAKKAHWITARENKVHAKGKGELDTYWLILGESHCPPSTTQATAAATTAAAAVVQASSSGVRTKPGRAANDNSAPHDVHNGAVIRKNSVGGGGAGGGGDIDVEPAEAAALSMKDMRLVDWNTTILLERIKAIVLHRQKQQRQIKSSSMMMVGVGGNANDGGGVAVEIPLDVMSQLHGFCTGIATMYNKNNPFHNFEHASHVTMSTTKLLARVVRWDDNNNVTTTDGGTGGRSRPSSHQPQQPQQNGCDNAYTRGITSDPLTQFAVIFSALIHDVDHSGVPNATLVAEKAPLAAAYKNKSVAENNSISVAWEFLMQEQFRDLVAFICPTKKDLDRLGDLVVNIVLATDIADKELKAARNQRWEKVFFSSPGDDEDEGEQKRATPQDGGDGGKAIDRMKATIVIEHLIQASDVCHTMQHWHVFRKWNERLFCETYAAYVAGRGGEKNPADFWYEGEIGFFDYYIIPLAKKLDECRVFGVSSDELLNYAQRNRREWEQKGKEVVETYKEKYCVVNQADGASNNNEQQ